MPTIHEVTAYLDEILNLKAFASDSSNNGLQFEGSREVTKAVFGVDACAGLFMDAADADADFVFVHHGLSWGGSLKRITGVDAERIAMLASNNISLYAAHLPLDANPEFGHNILLARILGTESLGVNSFHHMAVKTCAPALRVTARADDGITEAVELLDNPEGRFFLAVQWHPEMMAWADGQAQALLDAFVASCRETLSRPDFRLDPLI